MVKFRDFTPNDQWESENKYAELHLAMQEYLINQGDNFSVEIELSSVDAVRTAAYKYAESCGYQVSVRSKGMKILVERTSADTPVKPAPIKAELEKQLKEVAAKRGGNQDNSDLPADNLRNRKWKSYLQQIESLPVDGFEAHIVTDEPTLLQRAIANYSHRELQDADYKFRTRLYDKGIFVRKVKA